MRFDPFDSTGLTAGAGFSAMNTIAGGGGIGSQTGMCKSTELVLRKLPPAERRAHLLNGTQGTRFLTLARRVAMLREITVW